MTDFTIRYLDDDALAAALNPPFLARHEGRIDKRADGCWIWTGAAIGGYGAAHDGRGDEQFAHRISYRDHVGPIPDGHEVDHLCYVPLCVNPSHLEAVTRAENIRRALVHRGQKPAEHGSISMYTNHRCRCDACRSAMSAHLREYRRRKREQVAS